MASAATVQSLVDYYVNLLIIQYNNQPKARATIALFVQTLLMDGIFLDVLNGYDIDTAVGKQLDVLGKYAGVTRYFSEIDLADFFAFTTYSESNPDEDPKFGFSTYDNFGNFSYNGTLNYASIITTQNALSDDDFRVLIKLAILQNTCSHGQGEIDEKLFALFGSSIRMESVGDEHMYYFFTTAIAPLILAIMAKNLLPKPMGVRMTYVQQNNGNMFAFSDYSGATQPNGNGFTDYANYDTSSGQFLIYDQITQGYT